MVEKTQPEQTQIEEKPLNKTKISIHVPTIDLNHSEKEEEIISPIPVIVETGNDFQNLTNGSNGNLSSPLPRSQPSCQSTPTSYTILLSSIMTLSSFSNGCVVTPFMTKLYQNSTVVLESIMYLFLWISLFLHLLSL